ncbi:hypothetical protein MXB_3182 [Myxobolus squamalis]|nr:hypothetical protein MXB_3182 [Myxobolus squamalis]
MDRCQIDISPEEIKNQVANSLLPQDESFKNALSLLDSQTEYFPYVSLTISTKLLDTPNSYT